MPYSHMRTSLEALAWLVLILSDFRQRIGIRITWKGGKFIQLRCIYGFFFNIIHICSLTLFNLFNFDRNSFNL